MFDPAAVDRELCRDLEPYVARSWSQIIGNPFVGGFHIGLICRHLEAVARGEIKQLVINIPPGMSKSSTVSVIFPTWVWGPHARPDRRFMFATYADFLARRDADRAKELIESDWYQDRWPVKLLTRTDGRKRANTTQVYWTEALGFRFSTTVRGGATGEHAHIQVVDDPCKPSAIAAGGGEERAELEFVSTWWSETMATRKADPKDFARIIIMQRLHHDDLAGRMLDAGYTGLVLPMRFAPERAYSHPTLGSDPRTVEGELLCPGRYDETSVQELERDLGARGSAAQLQQEPTSAAGDIFKAIWFERRCTTLPLAGRWIMSVDAAFKDEDSSDFVAIHVWMRAGGTIYFVARDTGKWDINETIARIRLMRRRHKKIAEVVVEDKANGPAIIQTLRLQWPDVVPYRPEVSKVARARATTTYFEADCVKFLDGPDADAIRDQAIKFPKARHDDDVDAMVQALLRLGVYEDAAPALSGWAAAASS